MGNRRRTLDRVSIVLSAIVLAIGVLVPVLARLDSGVRLSVDEAAGRLYVESVEPLSPAAALGVMPGMVAVMVNDIQVIRLPELVYPDPLPGTTANPLTGEVPAPSPYADPPAPVNAVTSTDQLRAIANQPVRTIAAIPPAALTTYDPNYGGPTAWFGDDGRNSLLSSLLTVVFGMAILFGVAWWLLSGRTGLDLGDVALPLALASAAPFLLDPLRHLWHPAAVATLAVLLPVTMLPLAFALVERIRGQADRQLVLASIVVCAVGSVVMGLARQLWEGYADVGLATGLLTAGITVIPGFVAAGPTSGVEPMAGSIDPGGRAPEAGAASGRVLRSAELAIAGFTPAAALLTATSSSPWLFLGWIGAIAAAGRFTVRPLVRLARRAQLQRDLVVAATEAERARVAADIHDDALQELTLLVRRLDAAGDTEGADIARQVSDRLRAICGDLRLPILDDLGVGPALDWLVLRIERLAGGEVRLERADGTRPPPEVELAFFRVAQEALSNAVKHGRPPIVVRYRSLDGAASLSIDDAGSGIMPDAGDRAERDGRYGLLNMQQRAEGIGAILDVRRWPSGGTARPARMAGTLTGAAAVPIAAPIRLLVIDDHPVVREGTAALLASQEGIAVVGTAASLEEARQMLAREGVDVVLLDIRLGTESGLSLLTDTGSTAGQAHRPAILVLTAYDYPQYAEAALRLGAAGFVLKTAPMSELLDAIRRTAAGGLAFSVRPHASVRTRLSRRELEVVALVVEGRSNDEIAVALGIGAKTVETHLARLFERFGIASRTELATRALREGWLEVPPA